MGISQAADGFLALFSIGRKHDANFSTSKRAIENSVYIAFKSETRSALRFTLLPESGDLCSREDVCMYFGTAPPYTSTTCHTWAFWYMWGACGDLVLESVGISVWWSEFSLQQVFCKETRPDNLPAKYVDCNERFDEAPAII